MTSLRKQLATIHAKSTNELDLKALKTTHSKSLLFDPKIAADQSLDVIYQLCHEGFEELCALDSRFTLFEKSIFSQQSKTEDRLQMTQKENEELDAVLENFLGLVGARLLLRPAIKAVEWLIRRFRIHESNIEPLVLTFLPYHATPIFTTLLSILPKQLPPALKFLHPYMAQLANPPRAVIVYSATRNAGFFAALNRYVLNVARAQHTYHILLSFWASTVAQTLNDMLESSSSGRKNVQRQREEDLLTRILTVLAEGLGIRNVPELTLGCYMLIAVLVSKTNLNDRTLDELMSAITKSRTPETSDAALGCLALIAEQRQAVVLPNNVLKTISKIDNIAARLAELAPQQPVQRLTICIAQGVLNRASHNTHFQDMQLLTDILKSSILDPSQKQAILQQTLTVLRDHSQTTNGASSNESALDALLLLEEDHERQTSEQNESVDDQMDVDSPTVAAAGPLESFPHPLSTSRSMDQVPAAKDTTSESFLTPESSARFRILLVAFEQFFQTKHALEDFLKQPFLQRSDEIGDLAAFSFFMHVWTTSRFKLARIRALRLITERTAASNLAISDLQAMIPYTLCALSDQSKDVRHGAASLAAEIGRQLGLVPQASKEQGQIPWAPMLYGTKSLEIKWLSNKTAASFVKNVLGAGLEECVSDANHVSRIIQNGLDGSSHLKNQDAELHRDRLKTTQRVEVFTFLCSHISSSPLYSFKLLLLSMLNRVEKVGGHSRSKFLLPTVRQLASVGDAELALIQQHEIIQLDQMNMRLLEAIHPDEQDAIDYLLNLTQDQSDSRQGLQAAAFQRLRQLWPQLKKSKQKPIIETLLNTFLHSTTRSSSSACREESLATLKSIKIPSEVLITLVDEASTTMNHRDQPPASKKRRTSAGDSVVVGSQDMDRSRANMARLTLVLELVDGSRGETNLNLFYSLFKVLQVLQDYRAYTTYDLGYLQNLTLGSLSNIMKELDSSKQQSKVDGSFVRVDLLVDCVRNTTSVQARNLALLLLADLTKYTPQAVLHSIMPIFTLMSATTMQQSDEFSAHVVDQTIQQVVPLLSQTLREQKKDLAAAAAEILLSFAAAFEHIAPHRRLQLYTKLASSLGASESLFAMLATLFDRFPANGDVDRFSVSLFKQFTSKECLTTVSKYLDLVLDCIQPKPMLSRILLKDDNNQGEQAQTMTRLIASVPTLLKDSSFRAKLALDLTDEIEAGQLCDLFATVLEQTIRLSQTATEDQLSRKLCGQLLECLLSLFPLQQLVQSIQPLLNHGDREVTRSVLKTLELRVRTSKHADGSAKAATTGLLPRLTQMLRDETKASLKPNVLACVDQICEKFGKTNPSATFEAVEVIAGEHCVGSSDQVLRVLSLHCLASSVEILQNDFIPVLQQAVQAAIACVQSSVAASTKSPKLHNAAYAFFTALVDHVPFMVSRASLRAVLEASHISAMAHFDQQVHENRTQFLQLAATRLDMAMVLEVSGEVWNQAVQQGPQALREHVEMLKAAVDNHSKAVVSRNTRVIFDILLAVLDLRRACADDNVNQLYNQKQVDSLEGVIISLVISVVLKINDAAFRPFFSQLLEWSSNGLPKKEASGKISRSIAVFNLVIALSERLKSIFTVYFGYILDRANEVLRSDAVKDVSAQALRMSIIRALASSFKYDQDDFWQAPAHFDVILEPLVVLLSMQPASQVTSDVIPAITELAAAAASNDHHKDLNRLLLKSLKDDSPRVRLAAVRCQESLARRLGDEWLGHLPEMLPVINELQDDDDEEVERETHRWIKLIEETLGESLNSMLQ